MMEKKNLVVCYMFYLYFQHLTGHLNIRIEFHVSMYGANAESCSLRGGMRHFKKEFGKNERKKTCRNKKAKRENLLPSTLNKIISIGAFQCS